MSTRLKTTVVTLSACLVALLLMGALLAKSAPGSAFAATDDQSLSKAYRQIAVYTDVLSRIKSEYVEEPDMKSVTLGAINGLLEAIDPFASYLSADQYREYMKNKDVYKGGVGLVLSKKFGYVGVVDAIPGSPADKAGFSTGDMIESIRGIATRDMPLAYANLLLQGKPGTTVEVSVLSVRNPDPKQYTLTRAVVENPRVTHKMMPDQIGYIRAESLFPGAADEIAAAVKDLENQHAAKLLLDLRHCASSTPEEGVAVANLFQKSGIITYLEGQKYPRKNFEADAAKAITSLPLVVMTNRGTASAAEIASAALLDSKRADVVGERTYGDASVRQAITMDDGGAIILSVAKYYSPDGKAIQDNGVTPNVQVNEIEPVIGPDERDQPQGAPAQTKPEEDPILKKAIDVALHGVQQAKAPSWTAPREPEKPQMPPNVVNK
jgi:carboxyl-terminal processing protease